MTEKPILMSSPMVRAILDGTKTQTRRICCEPISKIIAQPGEEKSPDWAITNCVPKTGVYLNKNGNQNWLRSPYGYPGDRLWVKETFTLFRERTKDENKKTQAALNAFTDGKCKDIVACAKNIPSPTGNIKYLYAADFGDWAYDVDSDLGPWKPSIFMPRKASRITLEINDVRVERLQEISESDAFAEGCQAAPEKESDIFQYTKGYKALWESINGPGSWQQNPWVWVISFRRLK